MEIQPNASNPLLSIWTSPRDTIRRIVDSDPKHHVIILAMLAGFTYLLSSFAGGRFGDTFSLQVILIFFAIVGPILGIVILYICSALVRWTGSWFGGQASSIEVRAAWAWSSVPKICALVLWVPKIALFGDRLFTGTLPTNIENLSGAYPVLSGLTIAETLIGIWGFVVYLKCLGEVHRFSAWKALGASILGLLIIYVPLILIGIGIAIIVALFLR